MATVATLRDLVSALVDSAADAPELSGVADDMERFFAEISAADDLRGVLLSTVFSPEEKKAVAEDFLSGLSCLDVTRRFVLLAVEMDKVRALLESEDLVLARLADAAGEVSAEVTSAVGLSEEEVRRVSDALSRATGKKVSVSLTVDSSMIGGIRAKVGDRIYDNSVGTQLERIRGVLSPS